MADPARIAVGRPLTGVSTGSPPVRVPLACIVSTVLLFCMSCLRQLAFLHGMTPGQHREVKTGNSHTGVRRDTHIQGSDLPLSKGRSSREIFAQPPGWINIR